eukprot:Platyproteum_vivax@DN4216_c0_g1_i1.p1
MKVVIVLAALCLLLVVPTGGLSLRKSLNYSECNDFGTSLVDGEKAKRTDLFAAAAAVRHFSCEIKSLYEKTPDAGNDTDEAIINECSARSRWRRNQMAEATTKDISDADLKPKLIKLVNKDISMFKDLESRIVECGKYLRNEDIIGVEARLVNKLMDLLGL